MHCTVAFFCFILLCNISKTALDIVSMENLMSRMASGCAEELIIELLDSGIFMRLAKIHILISRVENRSAFCLQVYLSLCFSALNRLTAIISMKSTFSSPDFTLFSSSAAFFVPLATATRTSISPSL